MKAIGARAQSSKTYLEKNFESFPDATEEELITHALKALDVSANDTDLDIKNTCLSVVGIGRNFALYEEESLMPYVSHARALS